MNATQFAFSVDEENAKLPENSDIVIATVVDLKTGCDRMQKW